MRRMIILLAVVILLTITVCAIEPHTTEDGNLIIHTTEITNEKSIPLTDAEYDLLCRVLCLEDGGESEWSQRCVCSCIYNRLISGLWGNTVNDVLYAKGQFEVMPNVSKAVPSELTCEIVKDIFINGNVCLEPRVMFFRTDYYHRWARAEFNVGNVYFSSSWWYQ